MVGTNLTQWLRRSLTICTLLFLGTVALVFTAGLFLPDHFEVQQSFTMHAQPERIHPHLVDLARWREWTPWEGTDDTLVHEYSDPSSGVGAWHLWRGDGVGSGRIEITSASVERGVWYDMTFDLDPDPMRGALRYLPSDSGTLLEWSLRGDLEGPLERALGPILSWRADAEFAESMSALAQVIARSD